MGIMDCRKIITRHGNYGIVQQSLGAHHPIALLAMLTIMVGGGVERDEKKAVHYWELAAMGGHVDARHNLGALEGRAGNMDRALKHFMIAVSFGNNDSLESIKQMFMRGYATKDDYTKTLRAYQANLVEIKSAQRDEAAKFNESFKYY